MKQQTQETPKVKEIKSSNITLRDPALYFNRELSWIEFNRRVLEEARDKTNPLLERLKFLSIFCSNLDEFFMIRVSGIHDQIAAKVLELSPDGKLPQDQLQSIEDILKPMLKEQTQCFKEELIPELRKHSIFILNYSELDVETRTDLKHYFDREIFPVLTPLAFDPGHPFPYISNLSLNLAILVRSPEGEDHFARLKVPDVFPRMVRLDTVSDKNKKEFLSDGVIKFIWLEELIGANLDSLFPDMNIDEFFAFRVTRDTDVEIQEDEASDLLLTIEQGLRELRFGSIIRLEVDGRISKKIRDTLVENMEIEESSVYEVDGSLGLKDLMQLYGIQKPNLKDQIFHSSIPLHLEEHEDIFSAIRKKDILLHHPFDSFAPVVDFIKKAAEDPNVLAIKQTLYRVGNKSPIVQALIEAAENGKQVAVLVELKARFDEENNISWARALERVGVHVVYGLMGLKTHAKICLVVRKESDGIRRYVHLGTGNYNVSTTKVYTDFGLMTCREDIGADASDLYNYLTGYSRQNKYKKLIVAPLKMRTFILNGIEREIEHQKNGKDGLLIFKMNALVDPTVIRALYHASQSGVKINLIVRGICCLKPGLPGISENITVTSIVGRFLEHSRIYYFRNGGADDVYFGSADLMQRNLDRRVELLFPLEDKMLKEEVVNEVLNIYIKDNVKARKLLSDGKYIRNVPEEGEKKVHSQVYLVSKKGTGLKTIRK